MSYDQGKQFFSANAQTLSAGIKLTISPGLTPMKFRGLAVAVTTQNTVTPPVITPKRQPTAGAGAAGAVALATLTVPLALVAGKVVYKRGYDQVINPGENLVIEVTTASTAGAGDIIVEMEPVWEGLANNANATLSA